MGVNVRKITAEEYGTHVKAQAGTGKRAASRALYDGIVAEYAVGEFAQFDVDPGEKVLTVKNNIVAAAKRAGKGVEFLRAKKGTRDSVIRVGFTALPVNEAVETE